MHATRTLSLSLTQCALQIMGRRSGQGPGTIVAAERGVFTSTAIRDSLCANVFGVFHTFKLVNVVGLDSLKADAIIEMLERVLILLVCNFLNGDGILLGMVGFSWLPRVSAGRRPARGSS